MDVCEFGIEIGEEYVAAGTGSLADARKRLKRVLSAFDTGKPSYGALNAVVAGRILDVIPPGPFWIQICDLVAYAHFSGQRDKCIVDVWWEEGDDDSILVACTRGQEAVADLVEEALLAKLPSPFLAEITVSAPA